MRTPSILQLSRSGLAGALTRSAGAHYPLCDKGGKTSEGMSCDFATLAQCQRRRPKRGVHRNPRPDERRARRSESTAGAEDQVCVHPVTLGKMA